MGRMVFDPVPSRRLGKSTGVNNIPTLPPAFKETIPADEVAVNEAYDNKDILALLRKEKLFEKLQYGGHTYYLRKFSE